MFEISADRWLIEYDAANQRRNAQNLSGIVMRANQFHQHQDGTDNLDTGGRYETARANMLALRELGVLNAQTIIQGYEDGQQRYDLIRYGTGRPLSNIAHDISMSAIVAHGVHPGEDPALATLWVMLGPATHVIAVPAWVRIGEGIANCLKSGDTWKRAMSLSRKESSTETKASMRSAEKHIFDMIYREIMPRWRTNNLPSIKEMTRVHQRIANDAYSLLDCLDNANPSNQAPVVGKIESDGAIQNQVVNFSITANDHDGQITLYQWDFGDGHSSAKPSPKHIYHESGVYLVSCTVTDNEGVQTTSWRYLGVGADQSRAYHGNMDDTTRYLVQAPENWNGVVVCDLDLLDRIKHPFYQHLHKEGYGLAGTARRRPMQDQADDLRRVLEALDVFRAKIGNPKRIIVYGRSAGGAVALAAAETAPASIDAAVALSATTPVLTFNQRFDFFFILKALIAPSNPDLVFYDLPSPNDMELKKIQDKWTQALHAAQNTAGGKAHIALTFAMSQYAGFGGKSTINAGIPKPDSNDPEAVADAMFLVARDMITNRLPQLHQTLSGRWYGNDGADYTEYYKNSDPVYQNAVEALYKKANLDIHQDIEHINNMPRVRLNPQAISAILEHPVRTHRGTPRIPIFRMDNIADNQVPTAQTIVYTSRVRQNGLEDFYRSAVVNRGGHCFFTLAEELTALNLVMRRLDTGKWPAADSESLNALAASLRLDGSEFIAYQHRKFNGQWRLHTFSSTFDLSFQVLQKSLNLLETQALVAQSEHQELSDKLREAERYYQAKNLPSATDALSAFIKQSSAVNIPPGETKMDDLLWDAKMMLRQLKRDRP